MDILRISTCTYPVRDKDAETALAIMAKAGFKKVDLWGNMPHFSANPAQMDHAKLQAAAEKLGVKIANLGTYCGAKFASEKDAEQEAALADMKATIDVAAQLGCRSIRVRPGEGEDRAIIDRLVPYYKKSAEYAAQKGIYLGMENHKGSLAGIPDACVELCAKVHSRHFGVLYEPCNLLHAGVDYKQAFGKFAPYIVHMHLKDGREHDGKFARCMLGDGDVDVRWVVDNLNGIGYKGDFALEYEICDLVPIEVGLPKWLEYFRTFG